MIVDKSLLGRLVLTFLQFPFLQPSLSSNLYFFNRLFKLFWLFKKALISLHLVSIPEDKLSLPSSFVTDSGNRILCLLFSICSPVNYDYPGLLKNFEDSPFGKPPARNCLHIARRLCNGHVCKRPQPPQLYRPPTGPCCY